MGIFGRHDLEEKKFFFFFFFSANSISLCAIKLENFHFEEKKKFSSISCVPNIPARDRFRVGIFGKHDLEEKSFFFHFEERKTFSSVSCLPNIPARNRGKTEEKSRSRAGGSPGRNRRRPSPAFRPFHECRISPHETGAKLIKKDGPRLRTAQDKSLNKGLISEDRNARLLCFVQYPVLVQVVCMGFISGGSRFWFLQRIGGFSPPTTR